MKSYLYGLMIALFLLLPVTSEAGITGTVSGKVTNEDGEALLGATVRVIGTTRGAKVMRPDGGYDIVQVPAGSYEVKATFVGYDEMIKRVTVSADATVTVNFELSKGGGTVVDTINVFGVKLIDTDQKGSKKTYTREDMSVIPTSSVAGIVASSAGVNTSGTGYAVRNSRSSDTQIRIDGVDVTDQFSGGMGAGGTGLSPTVSSMMVEEVNVMSGGYSAEYGDAMGGVVNSTITPGRSDRYRGYLAYYTDVDALWGRAPFDVWLEKEGTNYKHVTGGEGAKLNGPGRHKMDVGINGPIPFLKKSTFSLGTYMDYYKGGSGYEVLDPAGLNVNGLENQRWTKNITGKLSFAVSDDISLVVGGSWGLLNAETNTWRWYYVDTPGVPSEITGESVADIPEKVAKLPVWNINKSNVYTRLKHVMGTKAYEIQVGYALNSDMRSRRAVGTNAAPSFFTGYELMMPRDEWALNANATQFVPGQDFLIDTWQDYTAPGESADGYYTSQFPQVSPLTGYYEGRGNSSGTNNPFGMQFYSATHGSAGGFMFREGVVWEARGKFSDLFRHGDFTHKYKTGFDVKINELHLSINGSPYDANAFRDVYTDKEDWGGNPYSSDQEVLDRTEKPYRPIRAAAYFEDQVDYKNIIVSFGLRADYFNANSLYRLTEKSASFIPITGNDSLFDDSKSKFQISPRLNIRYPISETASFQLTYGLYYQMARLAYMYDGFNAEQIRAGTFLGNPNMDPQKTTSYELQYAQALGDRYLFTFSTYYNDIYNQLGVQNVAVVPDPYYRYNVNEYGNNRGFEFEVKKSTAPNDPLGFDINYTLAWARGTSDGAGSNRNSPMDPFINEIAFPLSEYPLGRDVRHRVGGRVFLRHANNQGPSIGSIKPLENSIISLDGSWRSGYPYTVTDLNGNPLGERNANTQPSYWRIDARLSKRFMLKDWFGESMKNTSIELYVDMFNITNRRAVTAFYTTTGDPLDNGRALAVGVGNFSSITWYKDANPNNPTTYSSQQYDNYGQRLYSEWADHNSDGVVTQAEKYQSYINYVEMQTKGLGGFQTPFTIYGGINFRF